MTLLAPLGFAALGYAVYCVIPTWYLKWFRRPIAQGAPGESVLILTFDDGPDPRYTGKVLSILASGGVRAIFFLTAEEAGRHPDLVKSILAGGHEVGFHSLRHHSALLLGPLAVKKDFERGLSILNGMGCRVRFYRPPWGQFSLATLYDMRKYRLFPMLWTVMAQDWERESTAQRVLERLSSRVRPGSVICLHDAGRGRGAAEGAPLSTVGALPAFLEEAARRGFQFILPG